MSLSPTRLVLAAAAAAALAFPSGARAAQEPSRPSPRELAARIDALLEADWADRQIVSPGACDDETFVRRAYLQIAGRIPTAEESHEFLSRRTPEKREELLTKLVGSPGHRSHLFQFWADLLRAKSRVGNQISGEPYLHWIKEALAENRPYDQMVHELLVAEGAAHARENGATGYYLRDRGMPEDNMANTVRVFLGTRLECAQCHDHPFDKWKQKDFFGMAAFTGGIEYRDLSALEGEAGKKLRDELAAQRRGSGEDSREMRRSAALVLRPLLQGISGSGTGVAQLPDDYKYDDGEPGEWIEAKVLFGKQPELESARKALRPRTRGRGSRSTFLDRLRSRNTQPQIDSREAYAAWMTAPENPRFTRVIVNRLWKRAFGRGLVEPIDDWKDDTQASHPELLEFLARTMIALDYDLRAFEAVLYRTRAWQSTAFVEEDGPEEDYRFQGPLVRRLSAEQLWDSLMTLAVEDLDAKLLDPGANAELVYRRYEDLADGDTSDLAAQIELRTLRSTDPDAYRARLREMSEERRAERREAAEKAAPLLRELRQARQAGDEQKVAALEAELRARGVLGDRDLRRRGDLNADLRRASDLPSPAPEGHFLREFGQSDRETIEAAFDTPSTPQVLSLLNGLIDTKLLGKRSTPLARTIQADRGADRQIAAAYLAILTRRPNASELALWRNEVSHGGQRALDDLIWTLLNTQEFRFAR